MAQNLKLKLLTLITKLSDRDTYDSAATELESIARGLDPPASLPTFISCILSAGPTDKPQARKHCLHLISTLSLLYPTQLSPHLPKIITYLTRRLRDPDSSILRPQCVSTATSMSKNLTKAPCFNSFVKPLSESLFTEQELNSQIGLAACLAAVIEAARDPEPGRLGKVLVPKLERVLKSEGYKGKSGGLMVLGSVIWVGGVKGYSGLSGLVACLVGFLKSEEWAARKAAAEALRRLAVVERDAVAEFKSGCLKVFESRRFDKVKAAREAMSQMIEAWKQVPDVSNEASPPPRSVASSRVAEDASDGRYPAGSKVSSCTPGSESLRKKTNLSSGKTPGGSSSATVSGRRGPPRTVGKKTSLSVFGKKTSDWNVEVAVSSGTSLTAVGDASLKERNDVGRRIAKPETKRALFNKNTDENMSTSVGLKSGSHVALSQEGSLGSTAAVGNVNENQHSNHKDSEDLSLIRNQLVQIERQQSSLLDLLQSFMGNSQNGMRTLETRVHGLELALDEISHDLAVSGGRMTNSRRMSCCLLPGADLLNPKFRKKSEGRRSTTGFPSSGGNSSLAALLHRANQRNDSAETINLLSDRLRHQGGRGVIVNPLAEIQVETRGVPVLAQH